MGGTGFGRVRRVWCVGGVSGVEVGVESEGVVGIALEGPDAVVIRAAHCVADGVCQERVGADFHECRVVAAGRGYGRARPAPGCADWLPSNSRRKGLGRFRFGHLWW